MEYLFKSARVVHDPHSRSYTVEIKKRFSLVWQKDQSYRYYDKQPEFNVPFDQKKAAELAKDRVDQLIDKNIVYQKSNFDYYC